MDWNGTLDAINGSIGKVGDKAMAAMQKAASTGETTDYLAAQFATNLYSNVLQLQSALAKNLHDLVAGIIAKI